MPIPIAIKFFIALYLIFALAIAYIIAVLASNLYSIYIIARFTAFSPNKKSVANLGFIFRINLKGNLLIAFV